MYLSKNALELIRSMMYGPKHQVHYIDRKYSDALISDLWTQIMIWDIHTFFSLTEFSINVNFRGPEIILSTLQYTLRKFVSRLFLHILLCPLKLLPQKRPNIYCSMSIHHHNRAYNNSNSCLLHDFWWPRQHHVKCRTWYCMESHIYLG